MIHFICFLRSETVLSDHLKKIQLAYKKQENCPV